MLYDWRRCLSLAGAAAAVLLSTSCKDDPTEEVLPRNPSEGICFEPTFGSDDWNTMPQTRSGGVEEFPIDTTYVIEVPDATPEGEPLYVHVEVRDGIDSPTLRQLSADASQTRASMVDAKNFHPSFSAFAYSYDKWDGTADFNLMKELKVEKDKGWATEVQWPKTGSVNFYAYAPHQSDNKAATITYKGRIEGTTSITTGDGLILDYNEKGGVNFCDFVVGSTGTKSYKDYQEKGETPNMWFFHALAAVKVKSGSVFDRCYLSGLLFEQIYRAGTLRTHPNSANLRWSDHTRRESKNFLFARADYFWVGPNQNMLSKNAADSVYFAVPQELVVKDAGGKEQETMLKIYYTPTETFESNDQETVSLPIGKDKNGNTLKWETGKTYTYTITRKPPVTWDYTFEVEGSTSTNVIPEVLLHSWGTQGTINVKSHKKPQDGSSSQESVDWSCEYSTDNGSTWTTASGGNFNNVLTNFSGSKSAPAGNGTNHKLTVSATFPETFSNEYNQKLKDTPEKGSTGSYYDLSYASGSRNTANCYVVNGPGYYKFPAVYGNAITNGVEINTGYKLKSGAYTENTKDWLTYKGNAISQAWITGQYSNDSPFSCRVEWMDAPDLLTSVRIEGTGKSTYLTFVVLPDKAKQGNAVISLLDGKNNVMWSWHIWVTPYNPYQTQGANSDWNNPLINRQITNASGQKFTMMALPQGYVMGEIRRIESKSILLRFKQSGSDKTRTVKVMRQGGIERKPGHLPLFQWGRHVPVPGGVYASTTVGSWIAIDQVPLYGSSSTIQVAQHSSGTTTANSILNPTHIFHTRTGMQPWTTGAESWINRWDMHCTGKTVGSGLNTTNAKGSNTLKSVYDPSPAGYSLPTRDAFTGFCTSGTTSRGTGYKNWSTPFKYENEFYTEYGCHFWVMKTAADDQTFFLPTTGWRNPGQTNDNKVQGTANQARYWTATYNKPSSTANSGDRAYSLYFSITETQSGETGLNGRTMFIDTNNLAPLSDCMGVICVKDAAN